MDSQGPYQYDEFVANLKEVVGFLQSHGFEDAVASIYQALESREPVDLEGDQLGEEKSSLSAPVNADEYKDQELEYTEAEEERSKSAGSILTRYQALAVATEPKGHSGKLKDLG